MASSTQIVVSDVSYNILDKNNLPTSSILFGGKVEHTSESLAKKLAKKLNKQVFISCSIPYDQQLSILIERTLAAELDKLNS